MKQLIHSPDTINYRRLVEHIPAITYIAAWDEHSSTVYTSPQIEHLLGFTQAKWMADHTLWLKQIHSDDRQDVLEELERIRTGGDPAPVEYRMLTRDGCEVWFRDDAAIWRDPRTSFRPCRASMRISLAARPTIRFRSMCLLAQAD